MTGGATWVVSADAGVAARGARGASVAAQATACTITGTSGRDVLRGTAGDDVICGLAGPDILIGLGGDDLLVGGMDRDVVLGGPGDDRLFGDTENDLLVDRLGANAFHGGPGGSDRCVGRPTDSFAGCETVLPPQIGAAAGTAAPAAVAPTATVPGPAAPAGPAFDAAASHVTVQGDDVVVHVEETGLAPAATVDLGVRVERTTSVTCRDAISGIVLLQSSSTATAETQESATADAVGHLVTDRGLTVGAATFSIWGWDCTTADATVAYVHDATNDQSLTISA
jgi:hypothetical protein